LLVVNPPTIPGAMDEKEVVAGTTATWVEERFPDIVVGIDFGMTCTGEYRIELPSQLRTIAIE
jgi:hypothetical protein